MGGIKKKSTYQPQSKLWSMTEAKSHFGELVEMADSDGPQTITSHGKPVAVLVSTEDWKRRLERKGTLAEFLSRSPLAGSGLQVSRLGFLAGEMSVPADFDRVGGTEIEQMFDDEDSDHWSSANE